ncbi:MAG TPA: cupin domain-containing protein [Herpetosiphonaceae bacterium]
MIEPGFVIDNPFSRSRVEILPCEDLERGTGWLLEVRRPPGAGPDNSEHRHATWTESFEIIAGSAAYKLDGAEGRLAAGESLSMPPGRWHIHPWNAGDSELVFRQHATFAPADRRAFREVFGGFATIADLARQGKLRGHGRPNNPLRMAATLRLSLRYGRQDAATPFWVQRLVSATLGTLAEAIGLGAIDQRYR